MKSLSTSRFFDPAACIYTLSRAPNHQLCCLGRLDAMPAPVGQKVFACRHLDSDGDGCLSVAELKQALGDLGFGSRAQAAAEDMVREAAGKGVGSITQADFLQFFRRVGCPT